MIPAMLLAVDAEIAHRQAAVRADWATSRPGPRAAAARVPFLPDLRRRAARLLHA